MIELLILQYHKVTDRFEMGGTRVTTSQFRRHVGEVSRWGYRQLELDSLTGGLPKGRYVLFTFDDGFECVYFNAFPVLQKYGYKGLVFPVAGFIGKENEWDASFGIRFRQMDACQLRELAKHGWWIGSHTLTHPDLRKLDDRTLKKELISSKKLLEDIIGAPVISIAYPFGLYDHRVLNFVKDAGYRLGFTSRRNLVPNWSRPLEIERQGVYLIDMLLSPKMDRTSPIFIMESLKQITINQFARLSSLAKHDLPILRWISGMRK